MEKKNAEKQLVIQQPPQYDVFQFNYYQMYMDDCQHEKVCPTSQKKIQERKKELQELKEISGLIENNLNFVYKKQQYKLDFISIMNFYCPFFQKKGKQSQYALTWDNDKKEIILWKKNQSMKFKKINSLFLHDSENNNAFYFLAVQWILKENMHPGVIFLKKGQQLIDQCIRQLKIHQYCFFTLKSGCNSQTSIISIGNTRIGGMVIIDELYDVL